MSSERMYTARYKPSYHFTGVRKPCHHPSQASTLSNQQTLSQASRPRVSHKDGATVPHHISDKTNRRRYSNTAVQLRADPT